MKLILGFVPVLLLLTGGVVQGSILNVAVDQPGHKISPNLWGIFFEEINHMGDGGLYAELIKNRALSYKLSGGNLDSYSVVRSGDDVDGRIYLSKDHPLNPVLKSSLRLNVYKDVGSDQRIGISNSGYYGIPIRPDYTSYRASFYAKSLGSNFRGPLTVAIESSDGSIVYASAEVPQITDEFQKYEVVLTPSPDLIRIPREDNIFTITTSGLVPNNTSIFFNVISLFPPTFKNRPNGVRADISELLLAAKPSFLRFPGGNVIEGNNIDERYIWEETLGDNSLRPGHMGCWGYYSTDGLGLLEYFQFAEDIDAEPILGVFAGYALNGDSVPPQEMEPFIQSALNEIEYAIGDNTTEWGRRRIADGRVEPFKLNYVEIGNEDWFASDYYIRYPPFYDAITEKYPQLEIIATHDVAGDRPIPIFDQHFYPDGYGWFPEHHRYYDNHPRNGSRIFVGEYSTRNFSKPEGNTAAAMDDAAWMTGIERNSDIVILACFCPLLGNVNDHDFDGVYYNGLQVFGTPAWWVQHLFSVVRGDTYIPTVSDANEGLPQEKIFHVASRISESNRLLLKIVNTDTADIPIDTVQLQGVTNTQGGSLTVLTGGSWEQNDLENPLRISPQTQDFNVTSNSFSYTAPAMSLSILEIQL